MQLNRSQYEWQVQSHSNQEDIIKDLQEAGFNYSPAFLRLCVNRGLTTPEEIKRATDQAPQLFHDPFLMHDMQKGIERLEEAIANQERIVIYGDYDADGITSTLILFETLEALGANVMYYLPDRTLDGYGPNLKRYQTLIEEEQVNLILTCDNGVAGFEAIDYAMDQGVDVIVSDHHEIQDSLPNAYAIIHPRHPEGKYPFGELSGAGVALKIVAAMTGEIPPEAIELAAIGTVADIVSLTDENRTIVLAGLNIITNTSRIGLRLLLEREKVDFTQVSTQTIGFIIGPRLNAVGRLGDPTPGLELLATFDEVRALDLVNQVNQVNDKRQNIVKTIMSEIEQKVEAYDELPNIIIESSSYWQAGVLGIVASRIVEKYKRPVILFQYIKDKDEYKGSGRSVSNVNLFDWLNQNQEFLHHFGGHSQAAGMTVKADQWDSFNKEMLATSTQYLDQIIQPEVLTIDLKLTMNDIDETFIHEIEKLGPFGQENPEPIVMLENTRIQQLRFIGTNKQHVKMSLTTNNTSSLETIGFSMSEQCRHLEEGNDISVVGTLDINQWNNQSIPQLKLKDIGMSGTQWIDVRGSKVPKKLLSLRNTLYIFNHERLQTIYSNYLSKDSRSITYPNIDTETYESYSRLVIMEPPSNIDNLTTLYSQNTWEQVYVGSFIQESKYMAGLPTRQETSLLFKWIRQKPPFNIREHLTSMSQALNIHPTKLKLILVMFLEAEFVTIKDGWLSNVEELPSNKVQLTELNSYTQYKTSMQIEQLLNFQTIDTIKDYFEGKYNKQ